MTTLLGSFIYCRLFFQAEKIHDVVSCNLAVGFDRALSNDVYLWHAVGGAAISHFSDSAKL